MLCCAVLCCAGHVLCRTLTPFVSASSDRRRLQNALMNILWDLFEFHSCPAEIKRIKVFPFPRCPFFPFVFSLLFSFLCFSVFVFLCAFSMLPSSLRSPSVWVCVCVLQLFVFLQLVWQRQRAASGKWRGGEGGTNWLKVVVSWQNNEEMP